MLYFYGDPHFGDDAIRRYENRPFNDVKSMDIAFITSYNEIVTDDDTVIFTGDFGAEGYEKELLASLNGQKYLLKGNHDTKSNATYRDFGFIDVYDYPIILEDFWIISHEPMYVSRMAPYANIFAHVHKNPMYLTCSSRSFCTCVDRNDFKPVSFDYIKESVKKADETCD